MSSSKRKRSSDHVATNSGGTETITKKHKSYKSTKKHEDQGRVQTSSKEDDCDYCDWFVRHYDNHDGYVHTISSSSSEDDCDWFLRHYENHDGFAYEERECSVCVKQEKEKEKEKKQQQKYNANNDTDADDAENSQLPMTNEVLQLSEFVKKYNLDKKESCVIAGLYPFLTMDQLYPFIQTCFTYFCPEHRSQAKSQAKQQAALDILKDAQMPEDVLFQCLLPLEIDLMWTPNRSGMDFNDDDCDYYDFLNCVISCDNHQFIVKSYERGKYQVERMKVEQEVKQEVKVKGKGKGKGQGQQKDEEDDDFPEGSLYVTYDLKTHCIDVVESHGFREPGAGCVQYAPVLLLTLLCAPAVAAQMVSTLLHADLVPIVLAYLSAV